MHGGVGLLCRSEQHRTEGIHFGSDLERGERYGGPEVNSYEDE